MTAAEFTPDRFANTRGEAIMEAVEAIQRDLLPGDLAQLTVCAGPPLCRLESQEGIEAGKRGCPNCTRMIIGEELAQA